MLRGFKHSLIDCFMTSIEYINDHLFVDGVHGTLFSKGYFYCKHPNCPFALKMVEDRLEGKKRAVAVEKVICPVHYHEKDDKTKAEVRREIVKDLVLIKKTTVQR